MLLELFGSLFLLLLGEEVLAGAEEFGEFVFFLVNAKFEEEVELGLGFFEDVGVGGDQFLEDFEGLFLVFDGATQLLAGVAELGDGGVGVGHLDLIFSIKSLVNVEALLHAGLHLGNFLDFAVHLT